MSFFDWLLGKISSKKQFSVESQTSRTGDGGDNPSKADTFGEKSGSGSVILSELASDCESAVPVNDDVLESDAQVPEGAIDEDNVVEVLVYPSLDDELIKEYQTLVKEYGRRLERSLKERLSNYIDDTSLDGKAIKKGSILQQWDDLSDKQFGCLVEFILFEREYNRLSSELNDLLAQLGEDASNFKILEDEIALLNQQQGELKARINEFRGLHEKIPLRYPYNGRGEENFAALEYPELVGRYNFLIFSSTVESDREIIMESNYGDKKGAIDAVVSEFNKLSDVSYTVLSGNGAVHFLQDYDGGNHYRVYHKKINYERMGARKSKIGYILLSVNSVNLAMLKKRYSNLVGERIVLILNFGYLTIGKGSEKDLYQHFRTSTDKITEEIEKIVDLFGTPFSQDSFEEACSMIERGVEIIRSLNDNPYESLDLIDKRRGNKK